jgi:hypothetical protein
LATIGLGCCIETGKWVDRLNRRLGVTCAVMVLF